MSLEKNWKNKSIEVLEKQSYGDPATAPTALVKRCLEYVKLPVENLTIEQLRTLILQQIGLVYLVPLALDELDKDIMAEGDHYPGDLLKAVSESGIDFWKSNPELHVRVALLLKRWNQRIGQYAVDFSGFPQSLTTN